MLRRQSSWSVHALAVAITIGAAGCGSVSTPQPQSPDTTEKMRVAVESPKPPAAAAVDDHGHHVWKQTKRFYDQTGYHLAWSDGRKLRPQTAGLVNAIHAATADGLDPADYGVDRLDALRASFDPARAVDADLQFTTAYLLYASDLARGTIDPEEIDPHWHAAPLTLEPVNALQQGLEENRIEESLQRLAPTAAQYKGLKHQLALATNDPEKASRIAMNMERWRWLPDDLGSRYILVNIPAFHMDVVEDGKSVVAMKVVTGKKSSKTPVLADQMTSIVFSPYWNIPADIVEKEILPKNEKDPTYLDRMHIESDGQHYRQRPGAGNSLGLVKFIFPNHFNVYLHDTPSHSLFNHDERDLSHGCVRLERPADLAKYLLQDQPEWTDERIAAAMHAGVERAVTLKKPIPVYLAYFTAWEENGALQIVDDVYGYDQRHRKAVAE